MWHEDTPSLHWSYIQYVFRLNIIPLSFYIPSWQLEYLPQCWNLPGQKTISTSNWWTGYHELLLDIHSFHILCIQETSWLPATKRGTGRLHCTKSFKRDDQLWCSKSLPQSEKGHAQKLMKGYASGKIFRNKLEITLCIFIPSQVLKDTCPRLIINIYHNSHSDLPLNNSFKAI